MSNTTFNSDRDCDCAIMDEFNLEIQLLQDDVDDIESMVSKVLEDVKKYAATGKWNLSYQSFGSGPEEQNNAVEIHGAMGTGSYDDFRPIIRPRLSKTSIILLIIGIILYYIVIFWAHPEIVYWKWIHKINQ